MSPILCPQDIDDLRDVVTRRFGLNVENANRDRLFEALQRALVRTGEADGGRYVRRLDCGECDRSEVAAFVEDVTVAETYFFRHPDQFRAVLERAIVERRHAAPCNRRLRILSAGCASGEEAYSLAILVRDYVPQRSARSVDVRGIDINPNLLAKAARGRYTAWSLRGVPEEIQRRHFHVDKGEFELKPSVRELVQFEPCNLADDEHPIWQPGAFDVIFCRNVIMYFTPEVTQSVIHRFARSLAPGGFLFLGPVETLRGMSHDFHLQHSCDTFYYQRRSPDEETARSYDRRAERTSPLCASTSTAPLDESWVETICRASDRVASLSRDVLASCSTVCTKDAAASGTASQFAATGHLGAARQLVAEERFEEALRLLQALPHSAGQNADVQLLCAALLTNAGRVEEAEQLCRTVLQDDELNAEAHYVLALCREHAGAFAAAIEQDQMAIYLDSQFAMPHLHLALVAKRTADRRTAHAEFQQAALLLAREDASRIVLFGGGFGRESLIQLCRGEMRSNGGLP
jgi:chemotaxis protein methyltransferase CheR